jgi:hypothetical protein
VLMAGTCRLPYLTNFVANPHGRKPMSTKKRDTSRKGDLKSETDKPKKTPTVDLELPDEELEKATGGVYGAGGTGGWGVTNGCPGV